MMRNLIECQWSVNMSVADLDRAVSWYEKVFNAETFYRHRHEELSLEICFLQIKGICIELIQFDGSTVGAVFPDPPKHPSIRGMTHFSYQVTNLDAVIELLGALDVPVTFGPRIFPDIGWKLVFIRDLDGNLIKFVEILESNLDDVSPEKH